MKKNSEYFYYLTLKNDNIFYLVPKTGTRSIIEKLREQSVLDVNDTAWRKTPINVNYSFAIVRNCWDRLYSTWKDKVSKQWSDTYPIEHRHFRIKKFTEFKNKDFNYFVKNIDTRCDPHVNVQCDLININDVKFIGRFENIQEDFNVICDKIGISHQKLPHKNKTNHKHYTEYYDDETRQIVAEKYAKDIEYFGYEFGE